MVVPPDDGKFRGKFEVGYFLTIVGRSQQLLEESGPYQTVESALAVAIEKEYFRPPRKPANNAYIAADSLGIARVFLAGRTAGINRVAPEVLSIHIRREDIYLASECQYAREGRCH